MFWKVAGNERVNPAVNKKSAGSIRRLVLQELKSNAIDPLKNAPYVALVDGHGQICWISHTIDATPNESVIGKKPWKLMTGKSEPDMRKMMARCALDGVCAETICTKRVDGMERTMRLVAIPVRELDCIAAVLMGFPINDRLAKLTGRELDVLTRWSHGETNRKIANDLDLSVSTIESHRANIRAKLGATSIIDVLRLAIEAGL